MTEWSFPADWPVPYPKQDGPTFTLPLPTLTAMLRHTVEATEPTGTLPTLACVHIEWEPTSDIRMEGTLTFTATDRYQVIAAEVDSTQVNGTGQINLLSTDVDDLLRALPRVTKRTKDIPVIFTVNGDVLHVTWRDMYGQTGGAMYFTLHVGDFPKWRGFVNVSEEPNPVTTVAFNPRLLLALNKITPNQAWVLNFNGPAKAMIAKPLGAVLNRDEVRWTVVVMPVRLP